MINKTISESTLESLPVPTGLYSVGLAKYDLEDSFRKEIKFPNGRLIPIQIYFPIQKSIHRLHSKAFEKRAAIGSFQPLEAKIYSELADISLLQGNGHPVIILNHGSSVPMTDYGFLAEDLSSHGYVVLSIQHELKGEEESPLFWEGNSCTRNAKIIDNILYVFEWLKSTQNTLFEGKINLKKIGLVGHSLGANSLLLLANRTFDIFQKDTRPALFPRADQENVKECLVLMDSTRFSYPLHNRYPIFFLLSEEREAYQKETGCYDQMIQSGHKVHYYKGSTHISFMDHGYISPSEPINLKEPYFKGDLEQRLIFFDQVRKDVLDFLKEHIPWNSNEGNML